MIPVSDVFALLCPSMNLIAVFKTYEAPSPFLVNPGPILTLSPYKSNNKNKCNKSVNNISRRSASSNIRSSDISKIIILASSVNKCKKRSNNNSKTTNKKLMGACSDAFQVNR